MMGLFIHLPSQQKLFQSQIAMESTFENCWRLLVMQETEKLKSCVKFRTRFALFSCFFLFNRIHLSEQLMHAASRNNVSCFRKN